MTAANRDGHKVLWCGNSGRAADAQHLATECAGRFRRERRGFASIAFTTDTSILTPVGNGCGFEVILGRRAKALCHPGDVLIGLSTSGNSANVRSAIEGAGSLGVFTVGLTGEDAGWLAQIVDLSVAVRARETARIQERHILLGLILCEWVESELAQGGI